MLIVILGSLAEAGTVYLGGYDLQSFDTRTLHTATLANLFPYGFGGLASQPESNLLYGDGVASYWPTVFVVELSTLMVYDLGEPVSPYISGIGRDPVTDTIVGIGNAYERGLFLEPAGTLIAPLSWGGLAADWYPPGNYLLATDTDAGGLLHAIDLQGVDTVLGTWSWSENPPGYYSGIAYDEDTKLAWFFRENGVLPAVGFDPETLRVVVLGPVVDASGAAGWTDDVPDQTPHLYVTGTCPGTMYITVVDATPGGEVRFGSSTRLRDTVVPSGPCAGTTTALRNPTARTSLIAGSNGVASVEFQASAAMCGRLMVQAIDIDTCLTTSVQTVQNTWTSP
jgi:hypothetical protein